MKENSQREVYDKVNNVFDCRGLRPSDIKSNPRTQLPAPRTAAEEAELSTRRTLMLKEACEYLELKIDTNNLTASEARGLKKVSRRVEAGEFIVALTDKSGKFCVVSNEVWEEIGQSHVECDDEVTWEEVQAAQRRMKGHLRLINNIMNPGADGSQEDKVRKAKELRSTVIPVVSMLIKDHKKPSDTGAPKSRAVCGASSSINREMSEWVSMILDSVNSALPSCEVISTKELLGYID